MPVGAGIMQIGRQNVYATTTTLTSISPASTAVMCGDDIEFFVSVIASNPLITVNDGYFDVIDLNTETIIGSGIISSGTGSTGLISGLSGNLNVYISYNGLPNEFSPSVSAQTLYSIPKQSTTTSITDPPYGEYYCYYKSINITALVQATSSGYPTGNVYFRLYTDDTNYINLPTGAINPITGEASITMPEMTGDLDSNPRYIQAIYEGDYCFDISFSDSGEDGLLIQPTTDDPTSVSIDSLPGSYPISDPITFGAQVFASSISAPDGYDGYVKFSAAPVYSGIYFELGTSYMAEGNSSLTVPGNTFPVTGNFIVKAEFFTESDCYISSASPSTTIITIT